MGCAAAPGLLVEAKRVTALGWPCVGIVADPRTHSYGFHLCDPPNPDYSESGRINASTSPRYACAIDVRTVTPAARRYVKAMFERWDANTQPPDQAEFIGSPDGQRVFYASWRKPGRVETYRGTGHDMWCHASKFRSLARRDGRWFDPTGPYLGPILRPNTAPVPAGKPSPTPRPTSAGTPRSLEDPMLYVVRCKGSGASYLTDRLHFKVLTADTHRQLNASGDHYKTLPEFGSYDAMADFAGARVFIPAERK